MMTLKFISWQELKKNKVGASDIIFISPPSDLTEASQKLIEDYIAEKDSVFESFASFKTVLSTVAADLGVQNFDADSLMNDFIVELEWIIEDPVQDSAAYIEAQISAYTSLTASRLASIYLNESEQPITWIDARDVLITSDDWLDAQVDTVVSTKKAEGILTPLPLIVANHVGCTPDNENTRLGTQVIQDFMETLR